MIILDDMQTYVNSGNNCVFYVQYDGLSKLREMKPIFQGIIQSNPK